MARGDDDGMRVYVSGALKGSRDIARARALYELAAEVVTAAGHDAYLPHQHTDPELAASISPAQVFRRDVAALRAANGVVAFIGEPSLGVGAEIAICVEAGTPLLGLHMTVQDVSRFAVGLLEAAGARLVCYANAGELEAAIRGFIDDLSAERVKRDGARSVPPAPPPTL
jgi:2'-deoxynucleoside 5'-phosphate N-hydrolase